MVRSRRSATFRRLGPVTRSLTVLAAAGAVTGLLASSAGAAVAVPNPDGPGGLGVASPSGAHKTGSAKSRVGVPAPFTRDSRTVRHANGSYTTTIYPHPAFYHTVAGWRPIDSSLVAAGEPGFAWRNKANQYSVSFARHAGSHYLQVRAAGQTYDFDANGAAGLAGKTAGSFVSYAAAYPGADLTYDVGPDAVNETIVLHKASAPTSYGFVIHPPGGGAPLTAQRLADGSWGVFRAPSAEPVFVLQAPRAVDAAAGRSLVAGGPPHASMTVRTNPNLLDLG